MKKTIYGIINTILKKKFPRITVNKNISEKKIENAIIECKKNIDQLIFEYNLIIKNVREFKCTECNEIHKLKGQDLWFTIFQIEATYLADYASAFANIVLNKKTKDLKNKIELPYCINILDNESFNLFERTEKFELGDCIIDQLNFFILILNNILTIKLLKPLKIEALSSDEFERDIYTSLLNIIFISNNFNKTKPFSDGCVKTTLMFMETLYKQTSQGIIKDYPLENYSLLNLPELTLLAKRDKYVIDKYGEKEIENIFESQLNLLFQSFGFYVSKEQKGTRMIDLICISKGAKENYTILVEAKISGSSYNLRASDERAIKEYINNLNKFYTIIPPIAFCLIISNSSNRHIDKKLKKLSNDAKIPVKFCSIYEIVNLREKIVGSMDLEYFRKVFKSSDLIISKENIKEIVDQYNNESSVIESLIRTYQKKL